MGTAQQTPEPQIYHSPKAKAQKAIIALEILAVIALISIWSNYQELQLARAIQNNEPVTTEQVESNDKRQTLVEIPYYRQNLRGLHSAPGPRPAIAGKGDPKTTQGTDGATVHVLSQHLGQFNSGNWQPGQALYTALPKAPESTGEVDFIHRLLLDGKATGNTATLNVTIPRP